MAVVFFFFFLGYAVCRKKKGGMTYESNHKKESEKLS